MSHAAVGQPFRALWLLVALGILSPGTSLGHEVSVSSTVAPVLVLSSNTNRRTADGQVSGYRQGVRFWVSMLEEMAVPYRVIGDADLEAGLKDGSVLVLQYADRLSDAQYLNVRKFHEAGGGLLMAGLPGKYDVHGTPRDKSLPELWLGIHSPGQVNPREQGAAFFVLTGLSPASIAVDPGFRFELQWSGGYWAATTDQPAAYFTDWGLRPVLGTPPDPRTSAAMTLADTPLGRLAWMGFPPDAVGVRGAAREQAQELFTTLLRWTLRRPVVAKALWPQGRKAAAVPTISIPDDISAELAALICTQQNVRATFFIQGRFAMEYPDLLQLLVKAGEVANTSYYGEEEFTLKGQTLEVQLSELGAELDFLKRAGAEAVSGYRPPLEAFDENTLKAAVKVGYRFFFGDGAFQSAWPVARTVDGATLYQFPRLVTDAYDITTNRGGMDVARYVDEFSREASHIFDLGGVFPYMFHVQYEDRQLAIDSVSAVLAWLSQQNVWLTTFGDIVTWLESRKVVRVNANVLTTGQEISISNPSPIAIAGFPIVYVPGAASATLPENLPEGLKFSLLPPFGLLIEIDLGPYETRTITLK
jgi:peptidoglycan/xylan/chitin deacetylase (PgdA/CDA1 family)